MIIKKWVRDLLPKQMRSFIRNCYLYLADIFHDDFAIPKPSERHFIGRGFVGVGLEFMNYFINIGGLKPYHKVLDIGCGIGRMAIPLTGYVSSQGEYSGFDIVRSGISWAQKNISNKRSNFKFTFVDLYNMAYNPKGKLLASSFSFPYADNYFDFAFASSVFTHLLPDDTKNYLKETFRVLNKNGVLFATFFLFESESIDTYKNSGMSLKHEIDCCNYKCLVKDISIPEDAIAYDLEFISAYLKEVGLKIENIYYGSWSGRKEYLTAQDIIVIRKI